MCVQWAKNIEDSRMIPQILSLIPPTQPNEFPKPYILIQSADIKKKHSRPSQGLKMG